MIELAWALMAVLSLLTDPLRFGDYHPTLPGVKAHLRDPKDFGRAWETIESPRWNHLDPEERMELAALVNLTLDEAECHHDPQRRAYAAMEHAMWFRLGEHMRTVYAEAVGMTLGDADAYAKEIVEARKTVLAEKNLEASARSDGVPAEGREVSAV